MYARGMGKGIRSDHCFIGLYRKAGDLRHQFGSRDDLCTVDTDSQIEIILAGTQRHHYLFQRCITCALTQTIDGAFDLACAAYHHTGQRIRHGHAEIVVAVHRPDRLIGIGYAFAQRLKHIAVQLGHTITYGVSEVDRGRAFGNHAFEYAAEKIHI